MDEHGGSGRGGRSIDDGQQPERRALSDQQYTWGGRPGEDFGPIAPPTPAQDPGTARETLGQQRADQPPARFGMPPEAHTTSAEAAPTIQLPRSAPRPVRARPALWRPMLLLGVGLLVLVGLVGGVLLAISRSGGGPAASPAEPPPTLQAASSPAPSPAVAATLAPSPSPVAQAAATPSPSAARPSETVAAATPSQAVTPATPPTPPRAAGSPAPAGSPPTRFSPPVIGPTPPSLILPPGLSFPTSTPARIIATRTPLPVPTLRPITTNAPLRADRNTYSVGEEATLCAQATHGSSAQINVLGPDGSQRTLGEFQPPADRVCQTLRLDLPGLYVVTLTVRDAGGRELERFATVVNATR
ncbi:MAG: hypothetical protein IT306_02815 [Chloroflexi bacterium]|nr:hypothetical protein [Chloroflexota bacterium]